MILINFLSVFTSLMYCATEEIFLPGYHGRSDQDADMA